MKIMLGLFTATEGEVAVDEIPLSQFGLANFRRQIGVVMQDDQLLSGTIADNISFFAPDADIEQIRKTVFSHNSPSPFEL